MNLNFVRFCSLLDNLTLENRANYCSEVLTIVSVLLQKLRFVPSLCKHNTLFLGLSTLAYNKLEAKEVQQRSSVNESRCFLLDASCCSPNNSVRPTRAFSESSFWIEI